MTENNISALRLSTPAPGSQADKVTACYSLGARVLNHGICKALSQLGVAGRAIWIRAGWMEARRLLEAAARGSLYQHGHHGLWAASQRDVDRVGPWSLSHIHRLRLLCRKSLEGELGAHPESPMRPSVRDYLYLWKHLFGLFINSWCSVNLTFIGI